MKTMRPVHRRGFNIGAAGWFSVFRPDERFTALRQPRSFRYLDGRSESIDVKPPDAVRPLQVMLPGTPDRSWLRTTLIVLAALAVTVGFLRFIAL